MGDNRKARREQADGFQKETRDRLETLETTQAVHGEQIWRHKRKLDELSQFQCWKVEGCESLEKLWKEAIEDKNGGFEKIKQELGGKLAEETAKHLGFSWPLPETEPKKQVVGEEEEQVDTERALIWGDL